MREKEEAQERERQKGLQKQQVGEGGRFGFRCVRKNG